MISVSAVYENGWLKPSHPLKLEEGQSVYLSVHSPLPIKSLRPRTPEEEDFERRIKATKTLQETFAVIDTLPPQEYDLCQALDANRRMTGERLLYPEQSGDGKCTTR